MMFEAEEYHHYHSYLSLRAKRIITFLLFLNVASFTVTAFLLLRSNPECRSENVHQQILLPQMFRQTTSQNHTKLLCDLLLKLENTTQLREAAEAGNYTQGCLDGSQVHANQSTTKGDHFLFTIWWPPALAMQKSELRDKAVKHKKWLIHGLWPQADFEFELKQQSLFDFDKMHRNITQRLTVLMPNLVEYQEDFLFWQQQYNSHGRYSPFSMNQYFQKCIDLYAELNLPSWQRTSINRPNDQKPYMWMDFVSSLPSTAEKASANLVCQLGDNGKQYIREIQFCLNGQLKPTSADNCYFTDNTCDHCKPFYLASSTY